MKIVEKDKWEKARKEYKVSYTLISYKLIRG